MDAKRRVRISKYLSLHLRHQPERLGLTLQPGGWVFVEDLLAACDRNRFPITRAELIEVVETNDKQRFSFDETGERIRANQGHSILIDVELEAIEPPMELWHGTGEKYVDSIDRQGLIPKSRLYVHLSKYIDTAIKVGRVMEDRFYIL